MKDAYSFHVDVDDLRRTLPGRCTTRTHACSSAAGSRSARSKAQSGEIGGDVNHEFMAVAAVGEDDFVWCQSCDYAANVEAARRRSRARRRTRGARIDAPAAEQVHTPDLPGHRRRRRAPRRRPRRAAEVHRVRRRRRARARARARRPRGQRVRARAGARAARRCGSTTDDDFAAHPELPEGLHRARLRRRARSSSPTRSVGERAAWVTGANEVDHHVRHAVLGRDFHGRRLGRPRDVVAGDPCPRCGSPLSVDRGIEVGHVFQLGTKYSEALDAPLHRRGRRAAPDGHGLLRHRRVAHRHRGRRGAPRRARASSWPAALAPYDVHLVVAARARATPRPRSSRAADELYDALTRRRASPCSTTTATRQPGREVRRRRPARHAGAAHGRREGLPARRRRAPGPRDGRRRRALAHRRRAHRVGRTSCSGARAQLSVDEERGEREPGGCGETGAPAGAAHGERDHLVHRDDDHRAGGDATGSPR